MLVDDRILIDSGHMHCVENSPYVYADRVLVELLSSEISAEESAGDPFERFARNMIRPIQVLREFG